MNADIQHRLLNYTPPPPAPVWNKIATALDEAPNIAQKLHDFEAQPPDATWNSIAQKLTAAPKVVPLQRKLFQIAIAAAVLLAVAMGSLYFLKQSENPNLARQHTTTPASPSSNTPGAPTGSDTRNSNTTSETYTDAANAASATAWTADNGSMVHFAPQVRIANNSLTTSAVTVAPEETTMLDTELADRYMIATTPTGKAVRLPKKAYSDYACAVAYNNYQCKEKIASIQNKMAASVATDFTDFIDLLKNLQDNP